MSLANPYISIGIPTRNRGDLAEKAVQHILTQTFGDFEIILADSDETDDTRQRMEKIKDPRLRYYHTRGKTGPDNFEFTVEKARGEYFMFLTDRVILRPHALETLHRHSEPHRYPNIRYHCDTFDDRHSPPKVWTPGYAQRVEKVSPDHVLSLFTGENDGSELSRLIPMPQLSIIHRDLIEKIRGSENRRCFAPIVPDMWFCMAQLSCCEEEMLNIGEVLSVLIMRTGAGISFLLKKESGDAFLRSICTQGELDMVHVPMKSLITANMVYNDYQRAQKIYGGRLLNHPLPWEKYFTETYRNIQDSMKVGVNMRPEYAEWKKALAQQPAVVQDGVRRRMESTQTFSQLESKRLLKKARYSLRINRFESALKSLFRGRKKKSSAPYQTVEDYIAWDAARDKGPPAGQSLI